MVSESSSGRNGSHRLQKMNNYKIIAVVLLVIIFAFGFVFLNTGKQTEQKDFANSNTLKTNYSGDTTIYSDNTTQNTIPKIFSDHSEIKDSFMNYHNFSGVIGKIYKYVLTDPQHNIINITVRPKGVEEINGSEYFVLESKAHLPEELLTFHISKTPEYIVRKIITDCPPECEETDTGGFYWDCVEYIDIKTGYAKITATPWSSHYKIENNIVYERLKLSPEGKIEYEYNFTDYYPTCPEKLRNLFVDVFILNPLYLPGFINYKVPLNVTATENVKFIGTRCDDKKVKVEDITELMYNCTAMYNMTYTGKTDNKLLVSNSYVINESFYSSESSTNTMAYEEYIAFENLSFMGIEDFAGKKAYKIAYLHTKYIHDFTDAERFTLWVDKDNKILLGAKWEMNFAESTYTTYSDYKLLEEHYSYCGDKICDPDNDESSSTCCEDCGCKKGEECRGDFCMIKEGKYFTYKDEIFNYSISISGDFYVRKDSNTKILFYSENKTKKYCTLNIQIIPDRDIGGHYGSVEEIKKDMLEQLGDYENLTEGKIKINDLNADELSVSYYNINEKIKQTVGLIKKENYFYILTYTSTPEHYNNAYDDYKKMQESFRFL